MSIVVYDLEFTTWEGARARGWSGPGEHREIVQIGAIRLDDSWDEVASLETLVRPRLNPVLSDYFVTLTGVTQAMVDARGVDFTTAQAQLAHFADGGLLLYANGEDAEVLAENCRLANVPPAIARDRFRNVRSQIASMAGQSEINSCDLPAQFGFAIAGRDHDALADARAVAAAMRLARQRGLLNEA